MRLLVLLLVPSFACSAVMPPLAQPEQVQPEMEEMPPPPPGQGRVVFDVVDGPTNVYSLTRERVRVITLKGIRMRTRTRRTRLCTSPCATDLPYGRYVIGFPMAGSGVIEFDPLDVGEQPLVMRHALGYSESGGAGKTLGILGATFGGMAALIGLVFLPVGLGTDSDGLTLAGGVTLGAGAALMTIGIIGIAVNPDVRQPGASIIFPLQ